MHSARKLITVAASALMFCSCSKELNINDPGNLVAKTVEDDASLPSITVGGIKLHSEAFGHPDSTLVVFIHGGPGGDYRYLLGCKDLANDGYRVVFYDQRGSGLSQRLPKSFYTSRGPGAIDGMYEELTGVIAHYRRKPGQKVYLVGQSWGAILAAGYVGRYPQAIDGLVLCEPGGLVWDDIADYVKESRSFDLWGETLNDATYLEQFMTGKQDQHAILDYKHALISGKNEITGETDDAETRAWRSGAVVNAALFEVARDHRPDFSAGVGHYTRPVVLFYSAHNKAYGEAWARKVSAPFSSVTHYLVPGVGHNGVFSNLQAWNSVTKPRILSYFNSL